MVWKDVVGYEGIYEVSDEGEIRSCEGKVTERKDGRFRKWPQKVLKQKIGHDKCCRVTLYKNKKPKTWLVHRIVAFAFLSKGEGKDYVNHKDGNRLNNGIENLEWCDHKENNNHAFDNGLIKTGQKIVLINKVTKEKHEFRSKAKASFFLGKSHGFVSKILKDGKCEFGDFLIKTK